MKAERKRSQWPLLLFALAVLSALVIVPFLVLRPQNTVYVLRQFTAATVTNSTIEETVSSNGTVAPKDVVELSDGQVISDDWVQQRTILETT